MPRSLKKRPTRQADFAAGSTVRVAIYLRRSTDERNQPFTIGAQEHQLQAFIGIQPGWMLTATYTDDASGAKGPDERPGLRRMLADARARKFDVVLVVRLDRLARRIVLLHEMLGVFNDSGVILRSATEPFDTGGAMGKFIIGIFGIIAEFERDLLIDRVHHGLDEKARQGLWNGKPPFGYTLRDKTLVQNPRQAAIVRRIFDLYVNDRLGASSIRNWLNEKGYRTRTGKPWSTKAVLDIVNSYAYVGLVTRYDEIYQGKHKPIIDKALWDAAQEIAAERGEPGARRRLESDYLFSGLLRCGICGSALSGTSSHGRNGRYRYYTCINRVQRSEHGCTLDRVDADDLDSSLVQALLDTYANTGLFIDAARAALEARDRRRPLLEDELQAVSAELAETVQALQNWFDAVEKGQADQSIIKERLEYLHRRRGELQVRSDELHASIAATEADLPTEADVAALAARVSLAMATGEPTSAKKALLATLVDHVTVAPGRVLHPVFKVPGIPMLVGHDPGGPDETTFRTGELLAAPTGFEPVSPP